MIRHHLLSLAFVLSAVALILCDDSPCPTGPSPSGDPSTNCPPPPADGKKGPDAGKDGGNKTRKRRETREDKSPDSAQDDDDSECAPPSGTPPTGRGKRVFSQMRIKKLVGKSCLKPNKRKQFNNQQQKAKMQENDHDATESASTSPPLQKKPPSPPQSRKVLKKARQFDFDEMFAHTLHNRHSEQEAADIARISLRDKEVESAEAKDKQTEEERRNDGKAGRDYSDDEAVGPAIPEHLKLNTAAAEDEAEVGPALPRGFVPDKNVQIVKDDGEDTGFEEEITVSSIIPAAYEVTIRSESSKAITAISFDQQGTKFATGSYSYSVNLYEFMRMDSAMRSFRQIYPCESHVINSLAFNSNGETILIGSGNPQLKLLDRQGSQWAETVRGDQYLVDLTNTKGHTAPINSVCWHPFVKNEFLSCADDGSLRIWDTSDFKVLTKCINSQRKVIKTKNAKGRRAIPTTCCYSRDGKMIAAGCDDGSIQIWNNAKIFVNTAYLNRNAHDGPITHLEFSPDGQRIVSRSLDDTLKLWSLKDFKKPLRVAQELDTVYPQTDCGYSPHAEFIYTATNRKDKGDGERGALLFFDADSLELLYKIEYPKQGCVRALWHPKINQILVGLSDGTSKVYYDPSISLRGAIQCVSKPMKRLRESEMVREELILSPLTLEMFQPRGEDGEEKEVTEWRIRKFLRMQSKQKRPQFRQPAAMPMSGPSAGGRIRQTGGTLHSYVAKEMGMHRNKEFMQNEDIRGSILRHAEEAEREPLYVAKAYKRTQPNPLFQEPTEENEEGEEDEPVYKVPKLG
uniref:Uncharacterized protein n=1 Tax=Globodera rostochiensis TaxID=31243 RepID=A0A914HIU6_GLORO